MGGSDCFTLYIGCDESAQKEKPRFCKAALWRIYPTFRRLKWTFFILTTGGTIDKVHDVRTETLVFDGSTAVSDILKYGRIEFPRVESLMSIDSLDMTADHRDAILRAVIGRP